MGLRNFVILLTSFFITYNVAAKQLVGGDKDKHGCKPSTGYTWSAIRKECVRLWEAGVTLKSAGSSSPDAYVIFSTDRKKAEIFLNGTKPYPFLMKVGKKNVYTYKDYRLVTSNGYVLYRNNKVIHRSK